MKKSERLNQELIYLSDKKIFHLKEIEDQFSISERTALRDITDLERLGLSFYTEAGRNGGYHITNNKLLMPIRFNTQEINAIFLHCKQLKGSLLRHIVMNMMKLSRNYLKACQISCKSKFNFRPMLFTLIASQA